METLAGAELWGDQSHSVGLRRQGLHPLPHSQSTSLHTTFQIATPGAFCAACLPGVVGGVANFAPQLLCLFLRG